MENIGYKVTYSSRRYEQREIETLLGRKVIENVIKDDTAIVVG